VVPYTFHMNDIVSCPFQDWNPAAYEQALKDEFDQLYEEGAHRRRMMVVSLHDRISGHANRVRVLDRFLAYAKTKGGTWFARKDEIARWACRLPRSLPATGERRIPGELFRQLMDMARIRCQNLA
jgi:peptidoglycan/xylan/chitin deacetylase (PgdA/CDA1 family)